MFREPESPITEGLVAEGLLTPLSTANVDAFIDSEGLCVLFAAGPRSVRRESHDVAVALRELLREYGTAVRAGLISDEPEPGLAARLRVSATPCLTFAIGGEVLEALPRVRDWADYRAAFQRYLGNPDRVTNLMESA